MNLSPILDIAIGLFLVYFIVSSMASVVSEVIGMFLGRRSNTMAQFILNMFGEDINSPPQTAQFYKSSVFKLNDVGGFLGFIATIGRNVGAWVRDILHRGSPPVAGSEKVLSISNGNFSQAVFEVFKFTVGGTAEETFNNLKKVVTDAADSDALKDTPIAAALLAAVQQADGSVEKTAANLEKWFDGQMTQLSDYYKRRTRFILFLIGLLLAFFLNVDTIAVFQALQNNPTLRAYAVQQAQNLTSAPLVNQTATEEPNSAEQLSEQVKTLHDQFGKLNAQLNDLGLPIGWGQDINLDLTTYAGASKVVGIFITGVAIALGAQFWFDVLKLLSGGRSSSKS